MRTALFPGSFNPFTLGHASIVERALPLFDRMVIAVGHNSAKPGSAEAAAEAVGAIAALYAGEPRVKVIAYEGLTVDACRREEARWIVRGVRGVADFEYERTLADINRRISGIETVLLYALPEYESLSSSVVRELRSYGHDVTDLLPS